MSKQNRTTKLTEIVSLTKQELIKRFLNFTSYLTCHKPIMLRYIRNIRNVNDVAPDIMSNKPNVQTSVYQKSL